MENETEQADEGHVAGNSTNAKKDLQRGKCVFCFKKPADVGNAPVFL